MLTAARRILVVSSVFSILCACGGDEASVAEVNNGTFDFSLVRNVSAGQGLRAVAFGDANGDGRTDVFGVGSDGLLLMLQNADGSFASATDVATGVNPSAIVVTDLDGDAALDAVVANATSATVSVLAGVGDGTFEAATNLSVGANPVALVVADIDGDAVLDIAAVSRSADSLSVLIGDGSGGFAAAVSYAVQSAPSACALIDLDGDTFLDAVVANEGADTASILMNNGDGTFAAATSFKVGNAPSAVALGDLNDDGNVDIVLALRRGNMVEAYFGREDGSFTTEATLEQPVVSKSSRWSVDREPDALVVLDIDDDRDLDIVVTSNHAASVTVLLGGNTGKFSVAKVQDVGLNARGLAFSRIDDNDTLDCGVALADSGAVALLFGNGGQEPTPEPEPALAFVTDTVGTGVLSFAYASTVTTEHGTLPMTFALATDTSLPQGLALVSSGASVSIEGIPTVAGTHSFGLVATDSSEPPKTATVWFDLTVFTQAPGPHGNFSESEELAVGAEPVAIAIADLDGDADQDAVVVNGADNSFSVFLADGEGSFAAAVEYVTGARPIDLAIADFDGDGVLDLAVVNANLDRVAFHAGMGAGVFSTTPDTFATGDYPRAIAVGDFTNDGDADVVVANYTDGTFTLMLNDGDGDFTLSTFGAQSIAMGGCIDIQVADVDEDGNDDVLVVNSSKDNIVVFAGLGDGDFTAPDSSEVGEVPLAAYLVDFNGDGALDVAVLCQDEMQMLLGDGSTDFEVVASKSLSGVNVGLATADFDGDGHTDVAVAAYAQGKAMVMRTDGDGGFDGVTLFGTGGGPNAIASADVDGDGTPDLLVANALDDSVSVLLNE